MCLGWGFGCAPSLLAGVFGCVCLFLCALRLYPATPGCCGVAEDNAACCWGWLTLGTLLSRDCRSPDLLVLFLCPVAVPPTLLQRGARAVTLLDNWPEGALSWTSRLWCVDHCALCPSCDALMHATCHIGSWAARDHGNCCPVSLSGCSRPQRIRGPICQLPCRGMASRTQKAALQSHCHCSRFKLSRQLSRM